jgi:hypothetical protein
MLIPRLIWFLLALCLLAGWPATAQPIYYNTSSASQSLNTLDSVTANGSGNTTLFTASGSVLRCTAMAVDSLSGKLFFLDGASNSLWSANLDGSDLTLVKSGLTGYPTDLALDVLNQKIYFTTSSTVQGNNTVQVVDYTGASNAMLFTATGSSGNGVSRCTAIAVDTLNSKIFIADAGAQKIWSMNLAGSGLSEVAATAGAFPTDLALDPAHQQVYFTASSTVPAGNLVQRVNYNGSGLTTLLTASGGVQRCTALDLDLADSLIYLSDAGANTLWRIPLNGGGATAVLGGLPATAKKVRWYGGPSSRPPPGFTSIQLSGSNAILRATNGFVGGTYYILTSTNLAVPLNQWLPISTNVLTASGDFTLSATNTVSGSIPQRYYLIQVR